MVVAPRPTFPRHTAVILTALETEYQGILGLLQQVDARVGKESKKSYRECCFNRQANGLGPLAPWKIQLRECGRGQINALDATRDAVRDWQPAAILFIGCAGGRPGKARHFDVLIAREIAYYESAKIADTGFRQWYLTSEAEGSLLFEAAKIERDKMDENGRPIWIGRLSASRFAHLLRDDVVRDFRVRMVPIASGEKVIVDPQSEIWREVERSAYRVEAVETEGHGFAFANCVDHDGRQIPRLMIRGISDLLSDKDSLPALQILHGTTRASYVDELFYDDDLRQRFAAGAAGAFALQTLVCFGDLYLSHSAHSTIMTREPPGETTEAGQLQESSASPRSAIDYSNLRNRLLSFHPEVSMMRSALSSEWIEINRRLGDGVAPKTICEERARSADNTIIKLIKILSTEEHILPYGTALFARGGYGHGVLSLGSDIDIGFLHDQATTKPAEKYLKILQAPLTDAFNGVRASARPMINSIPELRYRWSIGFDDAQHGEEILSSFTATRHIAGNSTLHDEMRESWELSMRAAAWVQFALIARGMRRRLEARDVPSSFTDSTSLNIKSGPGGIDEHRLSCFLTRLFTIKGIDIAEIAEEESHSIERLLLVRDYNYLTTGTATFSADSADAVSRTIALSRQIKVVKADICNDLLFHLRNVRRRFRSLVSALQARIEK